MDGQIRFEYGYVRTWKFVNSERKSCGFKSIRIRVDGAGVIIFLGKDLLSIRNWCFDNQLLLNPDKTKLVIFGSRQMTAKVSDFRLFLLGRNSSPLRLQETLVLHWTLT